MLYLLWHCVCSPHVCYAVECGVACYAPCYSAIAPPTVMLDGFVKLPRVCLMELHSRLVTPDPQIGSKGTNGYVIVQVSLLYIFVLVLAIF